MRTFFKVLIGLSVLLLVYGEEAQDLELEELEVEPGPGTDATDGTRSQRSIRKLTRLLLGGTYVMVQLGNVPPEHPLVKYPDPIQKVASAAKEVIAALPEMWEKQAPMAHIAGLPNPMVSGRGFSDDRPSFFSLFKPESQKVYNRKPPAEEQKSPGVYQDAPRHSKFREHNSRGKQQEESPHFLQGGSNTLPRHYEQYETTEIRQSPKPGYKPADGGGYDTRFRGDYYHNENQGRVEENRIRVEEPRHNGPPHFKQNMRQEPERFYRGRPEVEGPREQESNIQHSQDHQRPYEYQQQSHSMGSEPHYNSVVSRESFNNGPQHGVRNPNGFPEQHQMERPSYGGAKYDYYSPQVAHSDQKPLFTTPKEYHYVEAAPATTQSLFPMNNGPYPGEQHPFQGLAPPHGPRSPTTGPPPFPVKPLVAYPPGGPQKPLRRRPKKRPQKLWPFGKSKSFGPPPPAPPPPPPPSFDYMATSSSQIPRFPISGYQEPGRFPYVPSPEVSYPPADSFQMPTSVSYIGPSREYPNPSGGSLTYPPEVSYQSSGAGANTFTGYNYDSPALQQSYPPAGQGFNAAFESNSHRQDYSQGYSNSPHPTFGPRPFSNNQDPTYGPQSNNQNANYGPGPSNNPHPTYGPSNNQHQNYGPGSSNNPQSSFSPTSNPPTSQYTKSPSYGAPPPDKEKHRNQQQNSGAWSPSHNSRSKQNKSTSKQNSKDSRQHSKNQGSNNKNSNQYSRSSSSRPTSSSPKPKQKDFYNKHSSSDKHSKYYPSKSKSSSDNKSSFKPRDDPYPDTSRSYKNKPDEYQRRSDVKKKQSSSSSWSKTSQSSYPRESSNFL